MADSVNALAGTVANTIHRGNAVAAPSAKAESGGESFTPPVSSGQHAQQQATAISPRIQVDPQAGVIIQFLDGEGNVQDQLPSTASVAYRRLGLDADGAKKKPEASDGVVA